MIANNNNKSILNQGCPMLKRTELGSMLQLLDQGVRDIEAIGSKAVDYAIDMNGGNFQTLTLTADITLSVVNTDTTKAKQVNVILTAGGAGSRALDFDAAWKWLGTMPTTLANGVRALLSVTTIGTVVVAAYEEIGDGS